MRLPLCPLGRYGSVRKPGKSDRAREMSGQCLGGLVAKCVQASGVSHMILVACSKHSASARFLAPGYAVKGGFGLECNFATVKRSSCNVHVSIEAMTRSTATALMTGSGAIRLVAAVVVLIMVVVTRSTAVAAPAARHCSHCQNSEGCRGRIVVPRA